MITLKGIFLSGAYGAIDLATKYIDQQQGMQNNLLTLQTSKD